MGGRGLRRGRSAFLGWEAIKTQASFSLEELGWKLPVPVESTDGQPVFPVLHSSALCLAVAFLDHTAAKKGAGAVPCGAGPEELGSAQALGANTPMGHRAHDSLLRVRALNCKSVG